jgi:hypothetical protein
LRQRQGGRDHESSSAVYAAILSSILAVWLFMPQLGSLKFDSPTDLLAARIYLAITLFVACLMEALHVAFATVTRFEVHQSFAFPVFSCMCPVPAGPAARLIHDLVSDLRQRRPQDDDRHFAAPGPSAHVDVHEPVAAPRPRRPAVAVSAPNPGGLADARQLWYSAGLTPPGPKPGIRAISRTAALSTVPA